MFPLLPFTLYPSSTSSCSYNTLNLYPPPPPGSPDDEGCKLLDGFAILVQFILASSAFIILVYKRYRERPQRPVEIWALDVSKQFIGAAVIHSLNILVSYVVGHPRHGPRSNLCVWYMLNVLVDCTLGVGILWCWLRGLQWFLEKKCHLNYVRSYGPPPLKRRLTPWAKQTLVFIVAEGLMKLCVYLIFRLFPILFRFGEWALRWTKGNYRYQVLFVMLIFPLFMNGMQFWIVDTIVKVTPRFYESLDPITSHHDSVDEEQGHPSSTDAYDERSPLLDNRL
ncbi:vacuolar membrane protein-domain-containing protein [Halteromyces radiatus]|uniref:vacuolar membrane protein-domain-containing protein n=1 Tax=Halteromyces radiatus TaxID=101107 RepID=UPI00221E56F7|nr:vacuolar membrane protein-domain-containing protein [Halteromyces radiatus]KAI8086423.1 vacuolar membrane protein-domain-containing protein [Halteromyces radiatus]